MIEENSYPEQPLQKTEIDIAGFVLGLLSVIFIMLSPIFAIILAILGFIFSLIQMKRDKTTLAIVGIILSIIGFILSLIFLIGFFILHSSLGSMMEYVEQNSSDLLGKERMVVRGYVYDEQNKPIPAATIECSCKSGLYIISSSDRKGYFSLTIPKKKDSCTIKASIANVTKSTQINLEGYSSLLSLVLPIKSEDNLNGSLEGYITNFALEPLEGVKVYEKKRGISTTTDKKGYYFFKDIEPGEGELVLYKEGYDTRIVQFDIYPGMHLEKNFSLATLGNGFGGIKGVVSYKGSSIENAQVIILVAGKIKNTSTDVNGNYEFTNVPVGSMYRVIALKKGFYPEGKVVDVSTGVDTKADLEFSSTLRGVWIGGFVTDEEGNPIQGASIELDALRPFTRGSESMSTGATGFYGMEFYFIGNLAHSSPHMDWKVDFSALSFATEFIAHAKPYTESTTSGFTLNLEKEIRSLAHIPGCHSCYANENS